MSKFKVYKYGLLAPTENASLVKEQMHLAHKYHNNLIQIERARRGEIRSITRDLDANVRQLEQKILEVELLEKKISKEINAQHSIIRDRISTQTDKEDLKLARNSKKEYKKLLREARQKSKKDPIIAEKLQKINDLANELIRSARAYKQETPYWGTYQLVEDAMEATKKMPLYNGSQDNNPKFSSWRGEGLVGVQIQGGLDIKDIFGKNTQIKVDPMDDNAFYAEHRKDRKKASRTVMHIRIGSDEKLKPIWASFPMIMHRPIPENSKIKSVKVQLKHIGSREEWAAHITVDMSNVLPPTITASGTVAVDIGWRDMKDNEGNTYYFRMAKWRGDDNEIGEIKLSSNLIQSIRKASDIKSIRDDKFNLIRLKLLDWLKNNYHPEWLSEKTQTLSQWRSIARLVNLVKIWSSRRFMGDEEIFGINGFWNKSTKKLVEGTGLAGWQYNDFHLWNWECSQRTKSLRHRKEEYRIIAAELANKYKNIILEDFDISDVSQKAAPDAPDDNQKVRSNKTLGSPSEFRIALVNAFSSNDGQIIKVDPAGTSYTCHLCSSKEYLDHTTTIHTCSKCNKTWDRDDNATANLLKLGCEQLGVAQKPGAARSDEKENEINEIGETRYQRRARAKQEKLVRLAAARKEEDKVSEPLN